MTRWPAECYGHGGRVASAKRAFPKAPQPWLDLSTGVNPWSYPAPRASREERSRLPDPEDVAALERLAAEVFGVADGACVAAVPGSETALRLLSFILGCRRPAVLTPAYGSYVEAFGVGCQRIGSPEEARDDVDVLVLGRPNNPDGRMVERSCVLRTLRRHRHVIVDEAFVDTLPEKSLAPLVGTPQGRGLTVLRSFGKFYGLAGLRLGFVAGPVGLISRLRATLGSWPVSADALAAGRAAYEDAAWAIRTRARLKAASKRLDQTLAEAGFEVVGGTSLFRLTRTPHAEETAARLARQGVLARAFSWDPTLIRFGLPASRGALFRLSQALGAARVE